MGCRGSDERIYCARCRTGFDLEVGWMDVFDRGVRAAFGIQFVGYVVRQGARTGVGQRASMRYTCTMFYACTALGCDSQPV
jgi:hypothetical protein